MQDKLLKTSGHAAFAIQFHTVFVTKYRHKCITADMLAQLRELLARVSNWRAWATGARGMALRIA